MSENSQEKTFWEKLQHNYRLVVMNNETFEEIGSYQLTLLNVYIALSTIVVTVAFAVILLIAFTPARRYIPGYGDASQQEELIRLNRQIDEMEKEMVAHRLYADNFRKILVGDVETVADAKAKAEDIPTDSIINVERIEEDEQLRREVQLEEIGASNQLARTTNFSKDKPLEKIFFTPPITGEISAPFMPDKKHYGIDIISPKNTAIKAALDGYVFISDWTLETGNTLGIQHANNIITFYKHNSVLLKKVGSYVKAGEAVAIIGNTGTLTDGPHLHFELWYRGNVVDPADYISF